MEQQVPKNVLLLRRAISGELSKVMRWHRRFVFAALVWSDSCDRCRFYQEPRHGTCHPHLVLLVCKVRHLISFGNCELVRIFGCSYPCKSHFKSDLIDSKGFPLGKFASSSANRAHQWIAPNVAVVCCRYRRCQPLNSRSDAERRAWLGAWTGWLVLSKPGDDHIPLDFFYNFLYFFI